MINIDILQVRCLFNVVKAVPQCCYFNGLMLYIRYVFVLYGIVVLCVVRLLWWRMKNYNDYDHNNEINVFFAFYKCRFLPRQNYLSIRHYIQWIYELYIPLVVHRAKKDYYPFDLCSMTYGKHYVVFLSARFVQLYRDLYIYMFKCHLIKSKSLLWCVFFMSL